MVNGRGHQNEATNRVEEPVNFSRPFFGETHRMDHANYLSPRWSVGGISVGNYRSDVPKLSISEPNVLMPVYYLPIMLNRLLKIQVSCAADSTLHVQRSDAEAI